MIMIGPPRLRPVVRILEAAVYEPYPIECPTASLCRYCHLKTIEGEVYQHQPWCTPGSAYLSLAQAVRDYEP